MEIDAMKKVRFTTLSIDRELAEALDNVLNAERSQGNKYLKNRSQLAAKWLWEKFREWIDSLKEDSENANGLKQESA